MFRSPTHLDPAVKQRTGYFSWWEMFNRYTRQEVEEPIRSIACRISRRGSKSRMSFMMVLGGNACWHDPHGNKPVPAALIKKAADNGMSVVVQTKTADECECDVRVELIGETSLVAAKGKKELLVYIGKRFVFDARRKICKRSYGEIGYSILSQIAADWTISDEKKFILREGKEHAAFEHVYRNNVFHNQVPVTPPFEIAFTPSNFDPSVLEGDVLDAYLVALKMFDIDYLTDIVREVTPEELTHNVWQRRDGTFLSDGDDQPPKLFYLLLRKHSLYNMAFGADDKGKNIIFSMEDMFPDKMMKAMLKYNKRSAGFNEFGSMLSVYLQKAMQNMYEYCGFEEKKGTQRCVINEDTIGAIHARSNSSAGIRPGPTVSWYCEVYNMIVKASVLGKKHEHWERIKNLTIDNYHLAKKGEHIKISDAYVAAYPKMEDFASMDYETRTRMREKLRLFFIVSGEMYMHSKIANETRQTLERESGSVAIGMSWFEGGADDVLKYLGFNRRTRRSLRFGKATRQIFAELDFRSLDATLKAQFLILYQAMSGYYFDGKGDDEIHKFFAYASAKEISAKLVHLFGPIWSLIIGTMWSGGYETSHGDTWCVLLIYFLFLEWSKAKFPEKAAEIQEAITLHAIGIIVYGDDSIYVIPEELGPYIGIKRFANFVKRYLDMDTRDLKQTTDPLSKFNPLTGMLTRKGTVFLKTYFVARADVTDDTRLPDVLPFREISTLVCNLPFSASGPRMAIDYIVAAINMAFDTRGTNHVAYRFARHMYDRFLEYLSCTWEDVVDSIRSGEAQVDTATIHKLGISFEELVSGFPSEQSLLERHIRV